MLGAAALFLVGVLVGGLAMRLLDASDPWRPVPRRAERFIERLNHELSLTPEQHGRIERIMVESHAEADALHEEMLPRVREHMRHTRERIRAVLTPEQQAEFDRLFERHRRRAERFLVGEGPPRHPRRPGTGPPPPPGSP
jgi:Spy/CpxP family protein refolding chaperone